MKEENTNFYKFAKKFCKENGKEFDNIGCAFFHNNDIPFDSIDRIYALYLIDSKSKLLDIDLSNLSKLNDEVFKSQLNKEEMEEFELVSDYAYDNYEREGMPKYVAFYNLLYVAKKGKEAVLKDSYYNDGWFGAS